MTVNFMRFVEMLEYMGIGMLCIFVVIGVIVLSVLLLGKVSDTLEARRKAAEEAAAAAQNAENQ